MSNAHSTIREDNLSGFKKTNLSSIIEDSVEELKDLDQQEQDVDKLNDAFLAKPEFTFSFGMVWQTLKMKFVSKKSPVFSSGMDFKVGLLDKQN